MSDARYQFLSRWRVVGTVDEVFDVLSKPEDLPRWWPDVYLAVETLAPGGEDGVGRSVRVLTKGFLPYRLSWQFRVVDSRRPHGFTIEATGDFVGRGVWALEQAGAWVDVTYDWRIGVEKPGIKQLTPVLRPLFAANHRWAMRRGEESLRLELERRRAPAAADAIVPMARAVSWRFLAGASVVVLAALAGAGLLLRLLRRRRRMSTRLRRKPQRC